MKPNQPAARMVRQIATDLRDGNGGSITREQCVARRTLADFFEEPLLQFKSFGNSLDDNIAAIDRFRERRIQPNAAEDWCFIHSLFEEARRYAQGHLV
jgi:hypothetical protein